MPNNLSQGAKDLLVKVRQIVPPLLEKFHKGEALPPIVTYTKSTDMGLPTPTPARSIGKGCSNWRQLKVRSQIDSPTNFRFALNCSTVTPAHLTFQLLLPLA